MTWKREFLQLFNSRLGPDFGQYEDTCFFCLWGFFGSHRQFLPSNLTNSQYYTFTRRTYNPGGNEPKQIDYKPQTYNSASIMCVWCERMLQAVCQMNLLSIMVCFCLQDPQAFSLALLTCGLMFCVYGCYAGKKNPKL